MTSRKIIIILAFIVSKNFAQSPSVPIDHPVYPFLERMEVQGFLPDLYFSTRPFQRIQVFNFLKKMNELSKPDVLNSSDAIRLQYYLYEFCDDSSRTAYLPEDHPLKRLLKKRSGDRMSPKWFFENYRNMVSVETNGFSAYIDPIFFVSFDTQPDDSVQGKVQRTIQTRGLRIFGNIWGIGYYIDARDSEERWTRTFQSNYLTLPGHGFIQRFGPHRVQHDDNISYFNFAISKFYFEFGRNNLFWGPSDRRSLVLSDNAVPFDYFKLQTRAWHIQFTYLLGSLIDYNNGISRRKYLATHRLDWNVSRKLKLGFYEGIIYKGDPFQFGYLNPIAFFRSYDHYLFSTNPGNAFMGADLVIFPWRNVKLYSQLFIDDIETAKIGSGWFRNKTAWIFGLYHTNIFSMNNLDLQLEYSRVDPFVYSHRDTQVNYLQFDSIFGHPIGPNAEEFYASVSYFPGWRWKISLSGDLVRKGENLPNDNVGGDVYQAHFEDPNTPGQRDYVRVLDGKLVQKSYGGLSLSFQPIPDFFINGDVFSGSDGFLRFSVGYKY